MILREAKNEDNREVITKFGTVLAVRLLLINPDSKFTTVKIKKQVMTYISAQPHFTDSWDEICYKVEPVWLTELLPDYDIMATDKQQIIVGQPDGGRKTIFGIQSGDYTIIPNSVIRDVTDELIADYSLLIKYTTTGEFSIHIILPEKETIGNEELFKCLILTNSYNGKTPFSIQGQTLTGMVYNTTSVYRTVCKNGLMGWADSFKQLSSYQDWLLHLPVGKEKKKVLVNPAIQGDFKQETNKSQPVRFVKESLHKQLYDLLEGHLNTKMNLTTTVYAHLQQTHIRNEDDEILKKLPIPVQLAKQAKERLRLEERMLNAEPSYWLMYNAVNHALFNARSSLTLNDRYRLDERVFHQLAAQAFA